MGQTKICPGPNPSTVRRWGPAVDLSWWCCLNARLDQRGLAVLGSWAVESNLLT
jgi:hypothetical protein